MSAAPFRVSQIAEGAPAWLRSASDFAGRHAVPLLALSPAAYISWLHMSGPMHYDPIVSSVIAGALEVLGYVTIDTLITALHSKRWGVAVASGASFVGYISIIVSLNTFLNIASLISPALMAWARVGAEAALVMLTVPAALWAASRETLRRTEENESTAQIIAANERAAEQERSTAAQIAIIKAQSEAEAALLRIKAEKQAKRATASATPAATTQPATATGATTPERAASFIASYFAANGKEPSLKDISAAVGVKASMASEYRKAWRLKK